MNSKEKHKIVRAWPVSLCYDLSMFGYAIAMILIGLLAGGTAKAQQASPSATQGSGPSTTPATPRGTHQGADPAAVSDVPGLGAAGYRLISPLVQPTLGPGVIELMDLEGQFADAVAAGGGTAFAEWFAEDAVVLNNGKPAVLGRGAIVAQAQWDPKQYHLTWTALGAQMGPSNDMGFTWGHYEGRASDAKGQPVVTSGRYITVWKKTKESGWKVAMDASATEPAASGDCCALPKP